jgi:hypothetical protein
MWKHIIQNRAARAPSALCLDQKCSERSYVSFCRSIYISKHITLRTSFKIMTGSCSYYSFRTVGTKSAHMVTCWLAFGSCLVSISNRHGISWLILWFYHGKWSGRAKYWPRTLLSKPFPFHQLTLCSELMMTSLNNLQNCVHYYTKH